MSVNVAVGYSQEIAVIKTSSNRAYEQAVEGFVNKIKELGYPHRIAYYDLKEEDPAEVKQIVVDAPSELILSVGTGATKFVSGVPEFSEIPIVFVMVLDADKATGSNITGVLMQVSGEKQIQTIQAAIPTVESIGVIYSNSGPKELVQEAETACQRLGVKMVEKVIEEETEVPVALRDLSGMIDALWLVPDANVGNRRTASGKQTIRYIYKFTLENKIPLIGFTPDHVSKGGLLGITINFQDMGRQAGEIADQIIKGTAPSQIDVARADPFIQLNLKTAEYLGLDIPTSMVNKATEVIKD
jgi:putative ABC transport system substrate-binding protein